MDFSNINKIQELKDNTKSGDFLFEDENKLKNIKNIKISLLEEHPLESYIYGDDSDYEVIMGSIERNGYIGNPIVVSHRDNRYIIISGHCRVNAYKQLGKTEIPCQIYEGLTEEQENDLLIDCNANRYREKNNEVSRARELDLKYKNYCKKMEAAGETPLRIDYFAKEHFGYNKTTTYRLRELLGIDPKLQEMVMDKTIHARSLEGVSQLTKAEQTMLADKLKEYKDDSGEEQPNTIPLNIVDEIRSEIKPSVAHADPLPWESDRNNTDVQSDTEKEEYITEEETQSPIITPYDRSNDEGDEEPKKKKSASALKNIRKVYDIINNVDEYDDTDEIKAELEALHDFIETQMTQ